MLPTQQEAKSRAYSNHCGIASFINGIGCEQRSRHPSTQLNDYVCYSAQATNPVSHANSSQKGSSGMRCPLQNYVTCINFSLSHQKLLVAIMKVQEPQFYHEVVRDAKRREAMCEEIDALEKTGTWNIVDVSLGPKAYLICTMYCLKLSGIARGGRNNPRQNGISRNFFGTNSDSFLYRFAGKTVCTTGIPGLR